MYNGIEEIAKMLKERQNPPSYAPVFATVEQVGDLKIRRNEKVVISEKHIKLLFDIKKQDSDGNYIYQNKTVAMLPYNNDNDYIVLGVVLDG